MRSEVDVGKLIVTNKYLSEENKTVSKNLLVRASTFLVVSWACFKLRLVHTEAWPLLSVG